MPVRIPLYRRRAPHKPNYSLRNPRNAARPSEGNPSLCVLAVVSTRRCRSSKDGTSSASRRDRSSRARTRDEIFALYCTFGETPHVGQDFLSKILNILREATEGLLSHAEVNRLSALPNHRALLD